MVNRELLRLYTRAAIGDDCTRMEEIGIPFQVVAGHTQGDGLPPRVLIERGLIDALQPGQEK